MHDGHTNDLFPRSTGVTASGNSLIKCGYRWSEKAHQNFCPELEDSHYQGDLWEPTWFVRMRKIIGWEL